MHLLPRVDVAYLNVLSTIVTGKLQTLPAPFPPKIIGRTRVRQSKNPS